MRPQRDAIAHRAGPLWIIAGPGTGKTEVLVDRCLKLLCVDDVPAGSMLVTTFTEKAAASLQDRLSEGMDRLRREYAPRLDAADVSDLRVGTLHSLCNEIMQEYRYPPYQNTRLLDEVEQALYIRSRRASALRGRPDIWTRLPFLVEGRDPTVGHGPNLWQVTRGAKEVFNRIAEDRLDIGRMRRAGHEWGQLADEYEEYLTALQRDHRCDFAHLQLHFLRFLATPRGRQFLDGDHTPQHPGIRHVLVDEYQDTNPVQEEIYLTLAAAPPHNLTVVGDDDQALYRFRGATVDCMVEFDTRCLRQWPGVAVRRVQLLHNFRSHPAIVEWCNDYIPSFRSMSRTGARAPGKLPLQAASDVAGDYPAVGWIAADRASDLPGRFVSTVRGLLADGVVTDYSQCVLLLRSSKETAMFAGPYVAALNAAGIQAYNPRSKAYAEREEVAVAMGALIEVLDPGQAVATQIMIPGVPQLVGRWVAAYQQAAARCPGLASYVRRSRQRIGSLRTSTEVLPAMPTMLYRVMSLAPFTAWQSEQDRDSRLSKLTRIFEAYCSLVGRALKTDATIPGVVDRAWLRRLYYLLVGYVDQAGMDDDEAEEDTCPPGRLPIMTIHQAKGLQFPFVFVGALGVGAAPGRVHQLEDAIRPFRLSRPGHAFSQAERAEHDSVRTFYVAYSRAQHALILLATRQQLQPSSRPARGGQGIAWFNQRVQRL
jgi:DNA helicase-2/ATP-dependent DNA helicase PcrA